MVYGCVYCEKRRKFVANWVEAVRCRRHFLIDPRAMHEKRYQRMKQVALTAEEEWRRRSEYLLAALI